MNVTIRGAEMEVAGMGAETPNLRRLERAGVWIAVVISVANVIVALFFLPFSPGFDERTLYTAVYSFQHYGRLMYPFYDLPLMVAHPPTKYWLMGMLVSTGVPLRLATAAILLAAYAVALAGVFACRLRPFAAIASVFALTAAVTLCPFIAYRPENPALADIIGRVRPDDLVLVFWFAGLFWLEASRRRAWQSTSAFVGAFCIAMAAASHYSGVPALGALAVYAAVALFERPAWQVRRLVPMILGVAIVAVPFAVGVGSHFARMFAIVSIQGGDTTRAFSEGWTRHSSDFWFLLEWMKRHSGNVWPARMLLTGPVRLGVPPVFAAAVLLLAFRSTRIIGLAALSLPLAVLLAGHKWIGYELPEIALYLLGWGWLVAALLERLTRPALRIAALGVCLIPLATASPVVWDRSALRFFDETHSPELLRAMGRSVLGPGATVVGSYYTGGEDNFVLWGSLKDPGVDFAAEHEFEQYGADLHDLYFAGQARLAGFVLTPDQPSASVVYFTAKPAGAEGPVGFITRDGRVERFSRAGTGWTFKMLRCPASAEELPWASPRPPTIISAFVPRTDHRVNTTLSARGLDGHFASLFLRRTYGDGHMDPEAMVALLIDDMADANSADALRDQCGCRTVESVSGGLTETAADTLLTELRRSDRVIRFYATAADFRSGRSMARRFFGESYP